MNGYKTRLIQTPIDYLFKRLSTISLDEGLEMDRYNFKLRKIPLS